MGLAFELQLPSHPLISLPIDRTLALSATFKMAVVAFSLKLLPGLEGSLMIPKPAVSSPHSPPKQTTPVNRQLPIETHSHHRYLMARRTTTLLQSIPDVTEMA
jgi:hypothetical protein